MNKILFLLLFPLNLLAIDPDRNYDMTPDSICWEYEELSITTEDGYDLNTWIYAPNADKQNDKVLILAYPDAGNMSYFVLQASILANLGYTVITFDYRGFGKSADFEIKSNYLFQTAFSKDLEAIVNFSERRFEHQEVGVWALSMGTMVTTYAYEKIKSKIDFLIFDAFILNPDQHIKRLKEQKGKETYTPIKSTEYVEKWQSIDTPILLFAGAKDELTTVVDLNSNKNQFQIEPIIKIYDGGHLMGFQHEIEKGFGTWYSIQMDKFIKEI